MYACVVQLRMRNAFIERVRKEFLQEIILLKEQLFQRSRLGEHYQPDMFEHVPFEADDASGGMSVCLSVFMFVICFVVYRLRSSV